MKNEKGITLIALVITVILMLILAGVAISALTGDGGLFDKSLRSAEAYEDASKKEKKQIDDLMNEIDGYIGDLTTDKKAPTVAKLEVSNLTDTGFTLTATGKDNVAVAKYEFYIKNDNGAFTLERTIESEDETVTYTATGKTPKQTVYVYKLKVYDKAGNSKESNDITIGAKKISETVAVGDYVDYDAGAWSSTDIARINKVQQGSLPNEQGEFGGFSINQSRNTNAVGVTAGGSETYDANTSGWRVWSVDNNTGVVTLVSAGCPEDYYHAGGYVVQSESFLKRNYNMYVNNYATKAQILTGEEAVAWYNRHFGTNYTLVQYGGSKSTFYGKAFSTDEPISVLKNGTYYWLPMGYDSINHLYCICPNGGVAYTANCALGVRVLVTLKADVLLQASAGDGSEGNPWKLVQ